MRNLIKRVLPGGFIQESAYIEVNPSKKTLIQKPICGCINVGIRNVGMETPTEHAGGSLFRRGLVRSHLGIFHG
jgi:hypothetical protein